MKTNTMPPISDQATATPTNTAGLMQMVPAAALMIEDAAPAKGDEVSYTVRGRVAAINGDQIEVAIDMINEEPAGPAMPEPEEDMMEVARRADSDTANGNY
jgi:hypothetical protein